MGFFWPSKIGHVDGVIVILLEVADVEYILFEIHPIFVRLEKYLLRKRSISLTHVLIAQCSI